MRPSTVLMCGLSLLAVPLPALRADDTPSERAIPKPSAAPTAREIPNVPAIGWGNGKETTFCGALEAALKATDHPADYATLMGATGLAFRVRWYQGKGDMKWSGSSPIGEGPEEFAAARKATGWELRVFDEMDAKDAGKRREFRKNILAALDAGQPVLTYAEGEKPMDLGVVYGYADGGDVLLTDDYYKDRPVRVSPDKIPMISIIPGKYSAPLPRREAFLAALRTAVTNWKRGSTGPVGERYWYGDAAMNHWSKDLDGVDALSKAERTELFHVSWWNLDSMQDARTAALTYLHAHTDLLKGDSRAALDRAIDLYDQDGKLLSLTFTRKDVFLGPWTGKAIADWTPEVRKKEQNILGKSRLLQSEAIAELEKILAAEKSEAETAKP